MNTYTFKVSGGAHHYTGKHMEFAECNTCKAIASPIGSGNHDAGCATPFATMTYYYAQHANAVAAVALPTLTGTQSTVARAEKIRARIIDALSEATHILPITDVYLLAVPTTAEWWIEFKISKRDLKTFVSYAKATRPTPKS